MRSRRTQKGTVIVLAAILLPILLAGLGLVIDNGQALDMKRRLQKAADAGALAAAHEIRRNKAGGLHQIALDNIKLNGFSLPDTNIQVFNPPKTGKRAGDKDFVEVVLRHEAPLYFMKAFYEPQVMVEARAIGGVIPQEICMLALNKTASPGLLVSGSAYVDVSQCGVQVDSNSGQAARSNGGGTLIAVRTDGLADAPDRRARTPHRP